MRLVCLVLCEPVSHCGRIQHCLPKVRGSAEKSRQIDLIFMSSWIWEKMVTVSSPCLSLGSEDDRERERERKREAVSGWERKREWVCVVPGTEVLGVSSDWPRTALVFFSLLVRQMLSIFEGLTPELSVNKRTWRGKELTCCSCSPHPDTHSLNMSLN